MVWKVSPNYLSQTLSCPNVNEDTNVMFLSKGTYFLNPPIYKYIYVYIWYMIYDIYVCVCIYMYTYIYYIYVCIYVFTDVCMYVCMYVYMYFNWDLLYAIWLERTQKEKDFWIKLLYFH